MSYERELQEAYKDIKEDLLVVLGEKLNDLLRASKPWEAIDGKLYDFYYAELGITGYFFQEEGFDDLMKRLLKKVTNDMGFSIIEDKIGFSLTIPKEEKNGKQDEVTEAQEMLEKFSERLRKKQYEDKKRAIYFANMIIDWIKTEPEMIEDIRTGEGVIIDLRRDTLNVPEFFKDVVSSILEAYLKKVCKLITCKISWYLEDGTTLLEINP